MKDNNVESAKRTGVNIIEPILCVIDVLGKISTLIVIGVLIVICCFVAASQGASGWQTNPFFILPIAFVVWLCIMHIGLVLIKFERNVGGKSIVGQIFSIIFAIPVGVLYLLLSFVSKKSKEDGREAARERRVRKSMRVRLEKTGSDGTYRIADDSNGQTLATIRPLSGGRYDIVDAGGNKLGNYRQVGNDHEVTDGNGNLKSKGSGGLGSADSLRSIYGGLFN